MDVTGPTLLQRALAVLQAKQYLVFYAIPLYAVSVVVPIGLAWLHGGGSVDEILGRVRAPLYDVAAAPGIAALSIAVVYLAVFTWFRAGYIRSIVGRFHLRPQDGAQFASLLGLQLLIEIVSAMAAWLLATYEDATVATTTSIVFFALSLVILYSDYAIVITGLDPWRAIARSWACVRANLALSSLLVLVMTLVATAAATLLSQLVTDGLLQALPLLVIYGVVMGVVTFAADVILVVAYVFAVENGRLPRAR